MSTQNRIQAYCSFQNELALAPVSWFGADAKPDAVPPMDGRYGRVGAGLRMRAAKMIYAMVLGDMLGTMPGFRADIVGLDLASKACSPHSYPDLWVVHGWWNGLPLPEDIVKNHSKWYLTEGSESLRIFFTKAHSRKSIEIRGLDGEEERVVLQTILARCEAL